MLTCDKDDGWIDDTWMWYSIFLIRVWGPVIKPILKPELRIFEKESNLSTLPSTSADKKLVTGSYEFVSNYKWIFTD